MLTSLLRAMVSTTKRAAGHCSNRQMQPVWVSIRHRATREEAINNQRVALARHDVHFDSNGAMHIERSTEWHPFQPTGRDLRQTTLSLFDGGRLLAKTEIFGKQWDYIDAAGAEGFLLEAVVTRNFTSALARAFSS